MRLVRYLQPDDSPAFGCIEDETVYQLTDDPLTGGIRGQLAGPLPLVRLLAPCRPSKIVAVAVNFPGIDGYSPAMSEPLVFTKPSTCLCNPGDPVVNPFPDLPWWGEAELAVVLKRRLHHATPEEVTAAVLGFTVANDTTVENVDGRDHHLARSKCPDGFCALGPWIDTDFDASDCVIEAVQNGEVIRRGRSSQQVWPWSRVVYWLSTWMTLEPWDVVLTGNPPDTVGMRYLNHGDTYTARVLGLGDLTNQFLLRKDAPHE